MKTPIWELSGVNSNRPLAVLMPLFGVKEALAAGRPIAVRVTRSPFGSEAFTVKERVLPTSAGIGVGDLHLQVAEIGTPIALCDPQRLRV